MIIHIIILELFVIIFAAQFIYPVHGFYRKLYVNNDSVMASLHYT